MKRTVPMLLLVIPGLTLAGPPAPDVADPLKALFEDYRATLTKDLGPLYRVYESLAEPHRRDLAKLPRPDVTLERLIEVDGLGALPATWIQEINRRGDKEQERGAKEAPATPSPAQYQEFERHHIGVEPSGAPIRSASEIAKSWPGGRIPPLVTPPFDQLKREAKAAPSDEQVARYRDLASKVEARFKERRAIVLVGALRKLAGGLASMLGPGASGPVAPGQSPWDDLGSPGLSHSVRRAMAERYFKGRWAAGRAGPQSTGAGEAVARPSEGGTGSGSEGLDRAGPTGSGDGAAASTPGIGGTGSGEETASPSPGRGTGEGEKPPGTGAAGGTGTGTGDTGSPRR